jgi:hypothetical protein
MPREPAYDDERRQDAGATAASERAAGTMPAASVRRRGTGSPEPAQPAAFRPACFRESELSDRRFS